MICFCISFAWSYLLSLDVVPRLLEELLQIINPRVFEPCEALMPALAALEHLHGASADHLRLGVVVGAHARQLVTGQDADAPVAVILEGAAPSHLALV